MACGIAEIGSDRKLLFAFYQIIIQAYFRWVKYLNPTLFLAVFVPAVDGT
jgi:hypothetical protein